jgi:hypothetical protein
MGLLDMLTNQGGSSLSAYDGATPPINPLATQQSKLHADGTQASYSVSGANFNTVNPQYQSYLDGVPNNLPQPSVLDRDNGSVDPSKWYLNNLPG